MEVNKFIKTSTITSSCEYKILNFLQCRFLFSTSTNYLVKRHRRLLYFFRCLHFISMDFFLPRFVPRQISNLFTVCFHLMKSLSHCRLFVECRDTRAIFVELTKVWTFQFVCFPFINSARPFSFSQCIPSPHFFYNFRTEIAMKWWRSSVYSFRSEVENRREKREENGAAAESNSIIENVTILQNEWTIFCVWFNCHSFNAKHSSSSTRKLEFLLLVLFFW